MVSDKVKTEEEVQLRDYEMVFIVSPDVIDEKFEAIIDNVSRFITEKGGAVSEIERWGKRKLAYPIRHYIEGNYVLVNFKMKPEFGKELEANLQIAEEVLRHLLIKLNG